MKYLTFKYVSLTLALAGLAMVPSLKATAIDSIKGARLDTDSTPAVVAKVDSKSSSCPMQKSKNVTYVSSSDGKNRVVKTSAGQKLTGDCTIVMSRSEGIKQSESKMVCKDEAKAEASNCPLHKAAK